MKFLIAAALAGGAISADEPGKNNSWFSSEGKATVELPVESRRAFAFGDSQVIEGIADWRGFELDLDLDGTNEAILRSVGESGQPRHLILRKFDREWEWIGWFNGEFSLVRQTKGWMDDIVAVEVPTKATATLKFDGIRYMETRREEQVGAEFKTTINSPDPFVPPPPGVEFDSPLVGKWVSVGSSGGAGDGPGEIVVITINEKGICHQVRIDVVPSDESRGDDKAYEAVGAELQGHESSTIDLRTGREILAPNRRDASFRSVHWKVVDGQLHWRMDMGTMGGQGVTYSPVN